jgi:pimeloyl-ACP methyl ester carboxylesterase
MVTLTAPRAWSEAVSGAHVLRLRDGRRLGYAEYGDRHGVPVLFFHGTPGSGRIARVAHEVAARRAVRIIAPDRPGFGLSDFQPSRRLIDWPDDVLELAEALGLERFAVAGVSGGGPYVAACAWRIANRLTHAGIISGMGPVDDPALLAALSARYRAGLALVRRAPAMARVIVALAAHGVRHFPGRLFDRLVASSPPADQAILARPGMRALLIDDVQEALRRGGRGASRELTLFSRPWGFRIEDIRLPVRLWHGEADAQVPVAIARRLAATIPRCHARFMPGAGHFWVFDHLDEVVCALI